MTPYVLIAVVFAVLYGYWVVFSWTLDLIQEALDRQRQEAALEQSREAVLPDGERGA